MRQIGFAMGVVCLMLANQGAYAQGFWYLPPGGDFSYRYGIDLANGFGYGYGFGFGYGSVVSPESAATDAVSDLTRLQSQFSVMKPQSAVDDEDEDTDQNADTELTVYQQRAQSIERQRARKLTHAIAVNEAVVRRLSVQVLQPDSNLPPRLTAAEFDRSTGEILWPAALLQDKFNGQRTEIESLLKSLVQTGVTTELNANIASKARAMHEILRKQIRVIAPKEYLEGIRFLNHLANEGKWPVS